MTAPETPAERWSRWQSETPARVRPVLESLRKADRGDGEGIAIGPSRQDIANAASMGRF